MLKQTEIDMGRIIKAADFAEHRIVHSQLDVETKKELNSLVSQNWIHKTNPDVLKFHLDEINDILKRCV